MSLRRKSIHIPFLRVACAAFSVALLVTPLAAQSTPNADGPGRAFTINPFFLLAGWISAEYEQRVNSSVTLGGGVSYFDYNPDRYSNFEVKARLYPNEHAMRGFALGASLGVTRLDFLDSNAESLCDFQCNDVRKKVTSPAFGIEMGYQWLLGKSGRTAISLGLGAKRFLASKSTLTGTSIVIPTSRLGIGYAF